MPKMKKDGEVYDCPPRNVNVWKKQGWTLVGEDKPKSFEKPKAEKVKNAK